MCHENEKWCKIWRRIDLSFQNWHEEFDVFWPEHLKVSKNFILMGSFSAKYILLGLKKHRGVIFHETEGGHKISRGIDLFQNWPKEFEKFWPERSKVSKIFTLMGSFWAKYILFELKKYRGVIFHETEEVYKIWRRIHSLFKNWHKNLTNFDPSTQKVSKIFILVGSFWAKYILFELKKYIKTNNLSRNWMGIENLDRNRLVVSKLA